MGDEAAERLVMIAALLYITGGLCIVGIVLGFPSARWLGNRIGQFLSGWNDEKYDVPPPRLAMASSLAAAGDLEGALAFYEILREGYPQEEEIHHRMLEISLGPLNRPDLAEEILRGGLSILEGERSREALLRAYDGLKDGTYRPMAYLRAADDARGNAFPSPANMPAPPILRPM